LELRNTVTWKLRGYTYQEVVCLFVCLFVCVCNMPR